MATALSNPNRIPYSKNQQMLTQIANAIRYEIRWGQVVKLPAFLLLSMTLCGLLIAGHTRLVEAESERSIAQTDKYIAETLQAASVSGKPND